MSKPGLLAAERDIKLPLLASTPTDARRDPLARAIASLAEEIGWTTNQQVILDATSFCEYVVDDFVKSVRSGERVSPSSSLRLEATRLLVGMTTHGPINAFVLTDVSSISSRNMLVETLLSETSQPVLLLVVEVNDASCNVVGRHYLARGSKRR